MSGSLTGRKQWKGQQLDYDLFIGNASNHYCTYCLSDTQAQALNSLIEIYQYKTRWFSLLGEPIDQSLTTLWYEELSGVLMAGCCGDENVPVRYKFEGLKLYRSTDGGITYNEAPEYDYRNTSLVWSKPSELGIESTKCQAADSVVAVIRDQIVQQIADDMTAAQILGVIAAVILFFATAGTSSFISASVTAVVAAILGAGVSAWQASFTTEVWDNFRCLVFCNMIDDESIDQAGLDAVYAGLDNPEKFTGIVVPTLKGYISAAGLVGIQNMLYGLSGDPDANCDTCECGDYVRLFVSTGGGTETGWDGEWLYASPVHDGDHYTLFVQRSNPAGAFNQDFCADIEIELLTGTISVSDSAMRLCHTGSLVPIGLNPFPGTCVCQIAIRNFEDVPFTVRLRGTSCS